MDIVNIVISGSFGQPVDLVSLNVLGDVYSYTPGKYPGGYIKLSSAKVTVYRTGNFIIPGIKTISQIDNLWDELVTIVKPVLDTSLFRKPTIKNMVALENLGKTLNLAKVIQALRDETAEYEPEVFPGLMWKTSCGSANIFQNGKVMLLGCKSEEELNQLWENISKKLLSV